MTAINAQSTAVTDYAPDPNGPGRNLVASVTRYLHGFLQPVIGFGDADPARQFHGDGPKFQDFRGGLGGAAPMSNGGYADIGSAVTVGEMGDPAARIFADRLAAGASVL